MDGCKKTESDQEFDEDISDSPLDHSLDEDARQKALAHKKAQEVERA